jgi:superfamily II DNA or RNA helicase
MYKLGIKNMSREIHIDSVELEAREQIMKELQIKIEPSNYGFNAKPTYICPIDEVGDYAYIPFAYGRTCVGGPFPCPDRSVLPSMNCKFSGYLRDEQKVVKTEAISHLNKYGSTIISAYPGFGKSCSAIYIANKIKLKTLIITHRIVLVKQWQQALNNFCNGCTVQVLTAQSAMKDCDFYIMNATNVPKHDKDFYKYIGFLIVDEIHCIMAEGLSKCMQRIVPRYLLGLSATPYREDGLDVLLDLYFGKRKIYRKLHRKHNVYKIQTSFVPTVEFAKNGKINWGVVLDSQANDLTRNEMIIRLVKHFPDRVFLILCKRVNQGQYLVKRFEEEGEDVTSLIGKQQEYEQKSRILVGTSSKAGTGFDHPRLDALILASDIQAYFIQYLGRVLRTEKVIPLIFDIVDKNHILDKHFKERRSVYLEHGGSVQDMSKAFPDFKFD